MTEKEIKCDCGKLLAKQHADGKIYVWCKKCRKEVEIKENQKWISVSERLPRKDEVVLCYFQYEPESPDVVCENIYLGGGIWLSEKSKVSYWMPLPKPPQ